MGEAAKYGLAVFVAVAFVGWITGMGGSLLPNLGFSALMGVLAALLFAVARKLTRTGRGR